MKKIIILIICVVIIVAIAAVILMRKPEIQQLPESGEVIESDISSKYGIIGTSQESTTGKANIHGVVPYFLEDESTDDNSRSLGDLKLAKDINNQIYDLVTTYSEEIDLFKDGVSFDDRENDIINNKQYRYNVSYDRYNNGNVISLIINMDYDTSGLRSNKWKEIFNVDVVQNKVLRLSDLFSSTNYKERILNEINKQAEEKYITLMDGEGLKILPNNQKFYIKDNKLVIYFEKSAINKDELEFVMPFEFNKNLSKFSY